MTSLDTISFLLKGFVKDKIIRRTGGVTQWVERFPSNHKAPRTAAKKTHFSSKQLRKLNTKTLLISFRFGT